MHAKTRKEIQERRAQEAQARTLKEEAAERNLRTKDLGSLKEEDVGQLKEPRRQARAAGVDPEKLESAMGTDDPHGVVVGMLDEIGKQLPARGIADAQVEAKAAKLFVDCLASGTTGSRDVANLEVLDAKQRAAREAAILSYAGSADEAVKLPQLLATGFPRKEAQAALATCNGDLDEAATTLLQSAMYNAIRRMYGVNVAPTPPTIRGKPETEVAPEPESAHTDDDPYLAELHTLKVSSLKRRCIALGATEAQIDDVDDSEERGVKCKDAVIELIMELKAGLRKVHYSDLKKRLRKRGLSEADIDALDYNDDLMGGAIDKLLELIARDD